MAEKGNERASVLFNLRNIKRDPGYVKGQIYCCSLRNREWVEGEKEENAGEREGEMERKREMIMK